MTQGQKDEALGWGGDDTDPTLLGGGGLAADSAADSASDAAAETTAPGLAPGWRVVGGPGEETPVAVAAAVPAPVRETSGATTQMSSAALLAHGVLGGIYLLYTIGWLVSAQRLRVLYPDALSQFMGDLGMVFAVLAAPLWFGVTLWNSRHSASLRGRLLALLGGAVLLIPVPFILGVQ